MNERFELYMLRQLSKLLSAEQQQLRLIQTLRLLSNVASLLSLGVLAFLATRGTIGALAGVVLGTASGTLAGLGFYFSSALKQWPVLKQHLNQDSILRRLKELET